MDLLDDLPPMPMTLSLDALSLPGLAAYDTSHSNSEQTQGAPDSCNTSSDLNMSPTTTTTRSSARRAAKKRVDTDMNELDDDDADFELQPDEAEAVLLRSKRKRKGRAEEPATAAAAVAALVAQPDSSVVLSRERLLTISSAEYEAFLSSIERALTSEEMAEVRRQRRLIKNRESAALSRNRKKQAMEVLEEENAALRKELAKAKAKLEQYERGGMARSVVMFALVLSVGLFWGSAAVLGGDSSPYDTGNLRRLMSFYEPLSLALGADSASVAAPANVTAVNAPPSTRTLPESPAATGP